MPKERVIVFDGEDKFIAPRNMVYDKGSGEAQVIGEETPPLSEHPVTSDDRKVFDDYMKKQGRVATMPSVGDPEFCLRIRQFIQSNGDGLATPEQVMEAHRLFQDNCVEKPKETPVVPPVESPKPSTPTEPIQAPAPTPEPKAPVETPKPSTSVSNTFVPLNVPTLGVRPSGGAGGGGGEEKREEKKKSNLWIWLIIGGVTLYFLTRKKD